MTPPKYPSSTPAGGRNEDNEGADSLPEILAECLTPGVGEGTSSQSLGGLDAQMPKAQTAARFGNNRPSLDNWLGGDGGWGVGAGRPMNQGVAPGIPDNRMAIPVESDMAVRVALPPFRPSIDGDEVLDFPHPPALGFGPVTENRTLVETDPPECYGGIEFSSFGVSGGKLLDDLLPPALVRSLEGPKRTRRIGRRGEFERHMGSGVNSPRVPIAHHFDVGQPLDLTGCPLGRSEEEGDFMISGGRAVKHDVVFGTNTPWITVPASLNLRSPLDLASCPRFRSVDNWDVASVGERPANPEMPHEL